TFIEARGGQIGNSLREDDLMPDALEILATAKEKGVNISLSVETLAADDFSASANTQVVPTNAIPGGWEGVDAGPASLQNWKNIILNSKTILWNGPVGVFEIDAFAKGTLQIAEDLAEATAAGAYTLVGGGDSVAAVTKMGYADKVSYVSTGGGAMLEAIEGKELPGIAAVRE
ncbi:MAG: phosphoglycerate kinase, partial [Bacteroidales bacterium]|nr:phosphoglycerate kinase [Bacteroidales bacterium]